MKKILVTLLALCLLQGCSKAPVPSQPDKPVTPPPTTDTKTPVSTPPVTTPVISDAVKSFTETFFKAIYELTEKDLDIEPTVESKDGNKSYTYKLPDASTLVVYESIEGVSVQSAYLNYAMQKEETLEDELRFFLNAFQAAMAPFGEDNPQSVIDGIDANPASGVSTFSTEKVEYIFTSTDSSLSFLLTPKSSTPDEPVKKIKGIEGSNMFDVTLSLEDRGFEKPEIHRAADISTSTKYCTMTKIDGLGIPLSYDLSVDGSSRIVLATFSALNPDLLDDELFLSSALPYLQFCSSLPYDDSDSSTIQKWVNDNITEALKGNEPQTAIGSATFKLAGIRGDNNKITFVDLYVATPRLYE